MPYQCVGVLANIDTAKQRLSDAAIIQVTNRHNNRHIAEVGVSGHIRQRNVKLYQAAVHIDPQVLSRVANNA